METLSVGNLQHRRRVARIVGREETKIEIPEKPAYVTDTHMGQWEVSHRSHYHEGTGFWVKTWFNLKQNQINKVLEQLEEDEWTSAPEIARKINIHSSSVLRHLRNLEKEGTVEVKSIHNHIRWNLCENYREKFEKMIKEKKSWNSRRNNIYGVMKYLEKNNWVSCDEIAKSLKVHRSGVSINLNRLKEKNIVESHRMGKSTHIKLWRLKGGEEEAECEKYTIKQLELIEV